MAQYRGFFKNWEIAVAKNLVSEFQNKCPCLACEGFDDLLQECLIHWCSSRKDYEPGGEASRRTFMGRIIRHKLSDIVREKETDKRKAAYLSLCLDEYLRDDECLPDLINRMGTGAIIGDPQDRLRELQLKMDIETIVLALDPHQQEICRLLGEEGLTASEVRGRLKMSRRAISKEIKRIRTIFRRNGFEGR